MYCKLITSNYVNVITDELFCIVRVRHIDLTTARHRTMHSGESMDPKAALLISLLFLEQKFYP